MNKHLAGATALAALAVVGLAGSAQAACLWQGNHWNRGGAYVYPRVFPHGTIIGDVTVGEQPPPPRFAAAPAPYYPSPPRMNNLHSFHS